MLVRKLEQVVDWGRTIGVPLALESSPLQKLKSTTFYLWLIPTSALLLGTTTLIGCSVAKRIYKPCAKIATR
jgi:hypothetical protein